MRKEWLRGISDEQLNPSNNKGLSTVSFVAVVREKERREKETRWIKKDVNLRWGLTG